MDVFFILLKYFILIIKDLALIVVNLLFTFTILWVAWRGVTIRIGDPDNPNDKRFIFTMGPITGLFKKDTTNGNTKAT